MVGINPFDRMTTRAERERLLAQSKQYSFDKLLLTACKNMGMQTQVQEAVEAEPNSSVLAAVNTVTRSSGFVFCPELTADDDEPWATDPEHRLASWFSAGSKSAVFETYFDLRESQAGKHGEGIDIVGVWRQERIPGGVVVHTIAEEALHRLGKMFVTFPQPRGGSLYVQTLRSFTKFYKAG